MPNQSFRPSADGRWQIELPIPGGVSITTVDNEQGALARARLFAPTFETLHDCRHSNFSGGRIGDTVQRAICQRARRLREDRTPTSKKQVSALGLSEQSFFVSAWLRTYRRARNKRVICENSESVGDGHEDFPPLRSRRRCSTRQSSGSGLINGRAIASKGLGCRGSLSRWRECICGCCRRAPAKPSLRRF